MVLKKTATLVIPSLAGFTVGLGGSRGISLDPSVSFLAYVGMTSLALYQSRAHAQEVLPGNTPDFEQRLRQETAKGGIIATFSAAAGYGLGYLIGSFYQ